MAVPGVEALDLSTLLAALPAYHGPFDFITLTVDNQLPSCRNCAKKKIDCIYHDHVLQEDLPRSYIASLVNHLQNDAKRETTKSTATTHTQILQPEIDPVSSAGLRHQFSYIDGTYRYLGGRSLLKEMKETPLHYSHPRSRFPELPAPDLNVEDVEVSPKLHEYLVANFFSGIHQVYPILDQSSPYLLLDGETRGPNDTFALQMMYSISCLTSPEQLKLSKLGASCYRKALLHVGNATVEPWLPTLQVAILLVLHSLLDPASGNIGQHIAFAIRLSIGLADTDGYDQDPMLWSLYPVVYSLENTVATALDRINTFQEPTDPLEFVQTDQSKFLCSLHRLQSRFRNHIPNKDGATLDDALAIVDTAGGNLHPNLISATLETQLFLEPSPNVAIRLLQSYEHPRFISTFVTPYWAHLAGTYVKKAFSDEDDRATSLFVFASESWAEVGKALIANVERPNNSFLVPQVINEKYNHRGVLCDHLLSKIVIGFRFAMAYDCETCHRDFATWHGASQHMNALDHWAPTFDCQVCSLEFDTQNAANQHMRAKNHLTDRYCRDCDRGFESPNNYRMHRKSRLHRGATVICPFCQVGFASASGVSHHLETGSCPNARGMDRDSIYSELRRRDPNGTFTQNLIGWHEETNVQNIATNRCWNGQAFECYLCNKKFRQLSHLDQHLNSPIHAQKYYHCPKAGCAKEFVSLAAMFNHLESESCGFIRFEQVQQNVNQFLAGGGRLISFH
ncbi:hypothetical protein EG327_010253 [Venturia inaequalis]|uniref:C2H2-type domain-containing protein n=1 Tax=Venturia inaequalis TaxID=5025 RepID=A0A8H3UJB7_VENIN|nr:hypothetical protein EG327_010253 [Venturia inaequalis]